MGFKDKFDSRRARKLNNHKYSGGPVVYWMTREQRVEDNWSLLYARELAKEYEVGLAVVFNLVPSFKQATLRQYDFMLKGLEQVEERLQNKDISFYLLKGEPSETLPGFIQEYKVGLLVTDFSPLRINKKWRQDISESIEIPMHMLDSHNIVPVWVASDKQEYAARTIRKKINSKLDEWLVDYPELYSPTEKWGHQAPPVDWTNTLNDLNINREVKPVDWITPGERAGQLGLTNFTKQRLSGYNELRNKPAKRHLSHLSPYYHFGQLSPQRAALEVKRAQAPEDDIDAYLEELIVRRELSDNYCYYNKNYDNFDGFPGWAQESLNEHRQDIREHTYTLKDFEEGKTHDDLWNASQLEMVKTGKMHGYMRMYWAKKILHWTESPEQAQEFAIRLNDTYELDGRDPNGYVGIAWSIGGVHDRGWTEREIFGKVRYMSRKSTGRKFDSKGYIEYVRNL